MEDVMNHYQKLDFAGGLLVFAGLFALAWGVLVASA
jgi:hypothetical protein